MITLLVFVNTKSGGSEGQRILDALVASPDYYRPSKNTQFIIVDMMRQKDALEGILLNALSDLEDIVHKEHRILVCGGDGTVAWVLSLLDSLINASHSYTTTTTTRPLQFRRSSIYNSLPLGIIPLGTGNDLSLSLNWGNSFVFSPKSLRKSVANVLSAKPVDLDRWVLAVQLPGDRIHLQSSTNSLKINRYSKSILSHQRSDPPQSVFNNYFSLGLDAEITMDFHLHREARAKDSVLNSQAMNKLVYGVYGAKHTLKPNNAFYKKVFVQLDGIDYNPLVKKYKLQGLIFQNIPSYAGGFRLWGSHACKRAAKARGHALPPGSCHPGTCHPGTCQPACQHHLASEHHCLCKVSFKQQSSHDGRLEVLGLTSVLDMSLHALGAKRLVHLAQVRCVNITTIYPMCMQVDGEPAVLPPVTLTLGHHSICKMLERNKHAPT